MPGTWQEHGYGVAHYTIRVAGYAIGSPGKLRSRRQIRLWRAAPACIVSFALMVMRMTSSNRIRIGIGGWSYEPWRRTFYPATVPKKSELQFASRKLTAIEVNSTFYRSQSPAVFAKWRNETPDDFVFTLKAPRFVTNRRVLGEARETMTNFLNSGIGELGAKLGPLLWQLPPGKVFVPADVERFFRLLPDQLGQLRLRHAFEVRHDSFMCEEYVALARQFRVTTVFADSNEYPRFADVTGDFIYARLMNTASSELTGYPEKDLSDWSKRLRTWAAGKEPADLPRVAAPSAKAKHRDVFAFFISGAKERAPAAAMETISLLKSID